jgi:peptidyl-prolyl cis-trans isomerase SurA
MPFVTRFMRLSVIMSITLSFSMLSTTTSVKAEIVDRVVALVNDSVITLSELEELTIPLQMRIQTIADPVKRAEILAEQTQQALEQLIGQELLVQAATEQGVTVTDEQVEGHLANILRQQGWGEAQLQQYLTAQGMTRAALKAQSKKFLVQQAVAQRNLASKLSVSEVELRDLYQSSIAKAKSNIKVEGSHIFLKVPSGSTAAAEAAIKQRANELLQRARAGEDFAMLAREFSQGAGADGGGDLGVVSRGGGLPTELEEAFFTLKQGELGGPIRSPFGYHVLYATKVSAQLPPSFEASRQRLEAQLRQNKYQRALKDWIEEMKKSAFIERRL